MSVNGVAALVVFVATLAYLALFAPVLQRIGDEGTLVNGAARVAGGAVPYRDFADLANPLSYLWLGSWFAFFGTRIAVARVLLVATGACTATLLFWLTTRAYGPRAGGTAALLATVVGIPFWPATNHHWDSNLFFTGTVCCLVLWRKRQAACLAGLAGAGAALTAGFMISKGSLALLLVVLVIALASSTGRARHILAALAGFCAGIGAMCLYFLLQGAWADFVFVNLVFPFTRYEHTGRVPYAYYFADAAWSGPLSVLSRVLPYPMALSAAAFLAVPLAAVVLLPLAAVAIGMARLRDWRRLRPGPRGLLWMAGAALWASELHRWDLFHLMYGSPILLGAVLGELLRDEPRRDWRARLVTLLTGCTLALGAWLGAGALSARVEQQTRRGDVRMHAPDEALQFLLARTAPGEDVYVYPYYPMYYFLADLRNPTRYGILLYGYNTTAQFQEAVADLERAKPRYVLWDTLVDGDNWRRWYPRYEKPPDRDLIVEPYLQKHYELIGVKQGFRIMKRSDGEDH